MINNHNIYYETSGAKGDWRLAALLTNDPCSGTDRNSGNGQFTGAEAGISQKFSGGASLDMSSDAMPENGRVKAPRYGSETAGVLRFYGTQISAEFENHTLALS